MLAAYRHSKDGLPHSDTRYTAAAGCLSTAQQLGSSPMFGTRPSSCISRNRRSAVTSWPPAWQMDMSVEYV